MAKHAVLWDICRRADISKARQWGINRIPAKKGSRTTMPNNKAVIKFYTLRNDFAVDAV
jgi:hypothetical protein